METCSITSSNDDLVIDMVHHVLGELDPDFQSVVLSYDENLLEAMTSYGP